MVCVIGCSRVARPPAKIATGSGLVAEEKGGSVKIEPKADFAEALGPHGPKKPGFVGSVEEEKSSSARPDEFAADGAGGERRFVDVVDDGVAHAAASFPFPLPMLIHDAAEFIERA